MNLINFTLDGKSISVPKGTTVYKAAKELGIDIPIFCYLDRMPPFGACRMCLVEVEKMGKLQTSCTLEATEGMIVKTQSQLALENRKEILELLLINHPLDCPICDRGGECPLQDQTLEHGPGKSRFYEEKRHFKKPIPLGPVLMLDRERCITCARCTRFGDEIAGDHALEFIDRGYKTEVGTPDGGTAKSKFIGNTILICPVGALTSDVYRFRARPWDNDVTESTCTLCPVGCSLYLDSRDGEIMRTRSRENRDLNDIWLCDKGWFGYEFSSNPDRLKVPLMRKEGKLVEVSWQEALNTIVDRMKSAKAGGNIAAFGGNPLTLEENYLFQKLMRDVIGTTHIDHRIGMPIFSINDEGIAPGMKISGADCEKLSYAVLLGLDLTEDFPVLWLRLRQAINKGSPVTFIGHYASEIKSFMKANHLHAPGKEIETMRKLLPEVLLKDGNGAIFVGGQYLASKNRKAILSELMKLKENYPNLTINIMEGRENSLGARLAGMHPELGPLDQKLDQPGLNCLQVMETAAKEGWDVLYSVGADPAAKFPKKMWKEARRKLGFLVVQDLFMTETAQEADIVLPALSFVEKRGTFLNIEVKQQLLNPGKDFPKNIFSDGDIFKMIAKKLNAFIEEDLHFLENAKTLKLQTHGPQENGKTEMASSQLLGSFAHSLFDRGVRMKRNTHLVQMSKDPMMRVHPQEGLKRGLQDGNRVKASSANGEMIAKVNFDEKVALGTIVLPLGFEECPSHELAPNLLNGFEVELTKA